MLNLRCKVCGEKAAGFHFGAFTCEGCKSFFGRCCNNANIPPVIGVCRNNKECVIDKKNRTSCKACRLEKCLSAGMSKSGSRYGRRSNWFKQYFQQKHQVPVPRSDHQPTLLLYAYNQHHHPGVEVAQSFSSLLSTDTDTRIKGMRNYLQKLFYSTGGGGGGAAVAVAAAAAAAYEIPLDLRVSQKHNYAYTSDGQQQHIHWEFLKKALPLDLSIK